MYKAYFSQGKPPRTKPCPGGQQKHEFGIDTPFKQKPTRNNPKRKASPLFCLFLHVLNKEAAIGKSFKQKLGPWALTSEPLLYLATSKSVVKMTTSEITKRPG